MASLKLITNKELQRTELYDIENDWAEANDVAADNPGIVQKMSEELDEWKASLPAEPKKGCVSQNRKEFKCCRSWSYLITGIVFLILNAGSTAT